jgi:hypothetical protein
MNLSSSISGNKISLLKENADQQEQRRHSDIKVLDHRRHATPEVSPICSTERKFSLVTSRRYK